MLLVLLASYNLGYLFARIQLGFLAEHNYVVVAIYGDSVILLDKVRERVGANVYYAHGQRIKIESLQRFDGRILQWETLDPVPASHDSAGWKGIFLK